MPRTSAQTVAQLVAEAGGVRPYLRLAGVPYAPAPKSARVNDLTPEQREYRNAARAVERASTGTGAQRHKSVSPKYSVQAQRVEDVLRKKEPPPPPTSPSRIEVRAFWHFDTDDPRERRRNAQPRTVVFDIGGNPARWREYREDPLAYFRGEMGGALASYTLVDLRYR